MSKKRWNSRKLEAWSHKAEYVLMVCVGVCACTLLLQDMVPGVVHPTQAVVVIAVFGGVALGALGFNAGVWWSDGEIAEGKLPTVDDFIGSDPEFTGGKSTKDYIEEMRE